MFHSILTETLKMPLVMYTVYVGSPEIVVEYNKRPQVRTFLTSSPTMPSQPPFTSGFSAPQLPSLTMLSSSATQYEFTLEMMSQPDLCFYTKKTQQIYTCVYKIYTFLCGTNFVKQYLKIVPECLLYQNSTEWSVAPPA